MLKRYKAWTLRQVSDAQCHPGVIILGLVLVLGIVCYVYRHIIEETLLAAAAALGAAVIMAVVAIVARSYVAWRRRSALAFSIRARQIADQEMAKQAAAIDAEQPHPVRDAFRMAAEADLLGQDDVDVRFGADGESLEILRFERELQQED